MFWGLIFSLIKVEVERDLAPIISFTLFVVILVAGVNLSMRTIKGSDKPQNETPIRRKVGIFVCGVLLYLGGLVVLMFVPMNAFTSYEQYAVMFVFLIGVPLSYLLYFVKERLWFFIASLSFFVMVGCLLIEPLSAENTDTAGALIDLSFVFLFQFFWMAVVLFSPLQQLTRRLGFAVIGVLTLVLLSEISKLNLHQYL
jgi:hypothetical protein